uniref:Retrotransposon gag domain-containing protein n=1 Tax=Chenopodium quinoa TaxID=63459 RepID=A0A803M9E5_CHEQI
MNAPRVDKVNMPTIESFVGTTNPEEHLAAYVAQMSAQTSCEATWCRHFPTTLKGQALLWVQKYVPKGSIHSYQYLERVFVNRFKNATRQKKTSVNMMVVTQGKIETLQNYKRRFNKESLKIHNLPDEIALTTFLARLSSTDFKFKLIK